LEYGGIVKEYRKVIMAASACKWMLDNPDIYVAGTRFDEKMYNAETPLFLLGCLATGLPGIATKKANDVGCYHFKANISGLGKLELWLDKKDIIVLY